MKKKYLLSIVALLLFTKTLAQEGRKFWIGPRLGINATRFIKHTGKSEPLIKPAVGISTEYRFKPSLALCTELVYATWGESQLYANQTTRFHLKQSYNTLSIPILIRYRPGKSLPFGEAGLQAGYRLNSKLESTDSKKYSEVEYNPMDFGFSIGIGQHVGKHFCIDLRYYQGLTKIYSDQTYVDPASGQVIPLRTSKVVHQLLGLHLAYYL